MLQGKPLITRLHVNQHNIRANGKGANKPVLTVKDYKRNRKGNTATLKDADGNTVATLVYRPDNPLSCGAKVWIETELDVDVQELGDATCQPKEAPKN